VSRSIFPALLCRALVEMAALDAKPNRSHIISATRMHLPADTTGIPETTQEHLRNYLKSVQNLGIITAIAVNAHEEAVRRIVEEVTPDCQVHVLPVPCWGAFVPALNALLGFAQRCGMKYILYQSLEVQCTAPVLQWLLNHHTADTLVVGPVFDGHDFKAGERPLNGRTAPWNTLALWSVRKLALTGFLCIADGLPDVPLSVGREATPGKPQDQYPSPTMEPMGSNGWWTRVMSNSEPSSVPAGVEEVTAIALLQHLLGGDRARAALLQLPRDLEAQLSWKASWGQDERRAQWHKYKMESKVSRPAAQLEQLFGSKKVRRNFWAQCGVTTAADQTTAMVGESRACNAVMKQSTHTATVMHYGESIQPPTQIQWICLASCGLFSANFTSFLASAFREINASPTNTSPSAMMFVGMLIGAVYLPMPVSLWLTRTTTHRANHIAGLVLFGGFLLLGHACMVLSQILGWSVWATLLARLVQGLGSGIFFQARFILASLSTSDQHALQQSLVMLTNDLGLGLGALLPAATSALMGSGHLSTTFPDLMPSIVLAFISLAYLVWVVLAFPKRIPLLSDRVRFPAFPLEGEVSSEEADSIPEKHQRSSSKKANAHRISVFVSGTLRVFVQSAIMPVVALKLRDANWTGNFRQTFAVAALCLLPMPFEAFAFRMFGCSCSKRLLGADGIDFSKLASGAIGLVALVIVSVSPRSVIGEDGETIALLMSILELVILMIALAMATPFNASRLYKLKNAERAVVQLEWMKAYIGRLLGPLFAVLLYNWVGYRTLLALLCTATCVVTLTA